MDALAHRYACADYARRLLRFQLDGLIVKEFVTRDIAVPALQYSGKMPLGYFTLKRQWLSPASIEHFLLYDKVPLLT